MNNFSDFDIKPKAIPFTGDKIKIKTLVNVQIKVIDFKIAPSKKKEGTEYLTLQIERSGDKRVTFTGSSILIDQIRRVPTDKFPFTTTIKQINEYYEFT
ncbi:MAG TPA: hypothetical protein VGK59_23800 [Ohtaekwangia sp.]